MRQTTTADLTRLLTDAGCSDDAAQRIVGLYEGGHADEVLREMRRQRCILIDQMHESQRQVDRMDLLIRRQEALLK